MLKSTHRPGPARQPPPLPPGWTEHKAPSGHTYYYNEATQESTYKRPGAPTDPSSSFLQHQTVPTLNLSDPNVANAYMAQYNGAGQRQDQDRQGRGRGGFGSGTRGGHEGRPRREPVDKPRSMAAIPGCDPWILVFTKYGRRFAYNPTKNASYWRIPDKLKAGILELDQARIRQKAGIERDEADDGSPTRQEESSTKNHIKIGEERTPDTENVPGQDDIGGNAEYDSSDYEEVEVTDDSGSEDNHLDDGTGQKLLKRRRTEEPEDDTGEDRPVEFNEDDIAAQLRAMGQEYGLDPEDYDDGAEEAWEDGTQDAPLSDEDARELFKDLLTDHGINPYSPWEKLLEEGKIINDARYTVLSTTKLRREVWEEWSRDKIKELRERRAKEEKTDPRIPYLALLQSHATPKLYWQEFKRKYKKEEAMRDVKLSDKDREKLYRQHIDRLKLPQSTLRTDLTSLLKSLPLSIMNSQTHPSHLPPQVISDVRYISLDAKIRDPLIEAYLQTLPPPEAAGQDDNGGAEAMEKSKEARRKREQALEARERAVAEEKKRQQWKLQQGRAQLREEELELTRAMQVGKRGLQSQLGGAESGNRASSPAE